MYLNNHPAPQRVPMESSGFAQHNSSNNLTITYHHKKTSNNSLRFLPIRGYLLLLSNREITSAHQGIGIGASASEFFIGYFRINGVTDTEYVIV